MKNRFNLIILIVFVLSLASVTLSHADEKAPVQASPIQVHGDSVEYFHEDQKAVGTGNVSIVYEGAKLTADKITVNMATKMATAEGNVVLTQEGSVFKGERGEYDFGKKIGNVSNMNATIEPSYYGKAQTIEKVSDNHYRAKNSSITTCCGDSPFYKIQAQQVDIYPGQKVEARNALLFIKDVPVLWIPYFVTYILDFERFPIQIIPGKNSEWGAFVLTKYRYHLIDSPELKVKGNLLFDYREKRGFGGGTENFYKGSPLVGRGALRTYYVEDEDAPTAIDEQRYRVQWRHQSKLTKDTTLTTEINKLSDPTIIKDFFFREEYERDVFPDNYISVITAKPEYTLSVLARTRLDDFFNVVERTPEVRFDTHNRQFADTPFYLRQEAQFSILKKSFDGYDDSLDANRIETNHTVLYAGRIGDLSVTPRIGTHQTYYSRDNAGERDLIRGTVDPGLDTSIKFFKVYNIYIKAFGLDYNQIRHIFTPTASYNFRPNPTVSRTTLQQFDSIDALDKQNFVRYAFENKLQTKEHNESGELYSREIARVIPFFDHDLRTGRIENLGIDVELRPYTWLGIESDATFNTRTRDFETANLDVYFTRGGLRVAVGQRYVQHESSQMTAQVVLKINEEWSVKVYDRFEFQEGESEEFEVTVSKAFDCVIADLTYNHRDGDAFFLVLRLKAFPRASFGLSQSYNRPKTTPREL